MGDLSNPLTRIEQYLAGIAGVLEAVPETPLTRIEEYLKACYENISSVAEQTAEEAAENLAAPYDSEGSYTAGDYVTYEGKLYKALADSAEPAGDWVPEDWTLSPVMPVVRSLELEPVEFSLPADDYTDIATSVSRLGNLYFITIDYAMPPALTQFDNRHTVLRVPAFNDIPIKTHFGCGIFNGYDPEADPPAYGGDGSAKSFTCIWQLSTNSFVTSAAQSGISKGRVAGAGLVYVPTPYGGNS